MIKFSALWGSHPSLSGNHSPCTDPAGNTDYDNQCAIRLSVALNSNGVEASQLKMNSGKSPKMCPLHGQKMHMLSAEEVANALDSSTIPGISPRMQPNPNPKQFDQVLKGKKGIIFFSNYWERDGEVVPTGDHIDFWDGKQTTAMAIGGGSIEGYSAAKHIWFWEVKA